MMNDTTFHGAAEPRNDADYREVGMAVRREIFGDEYIDRVDAETVEVTEDFRDLVTRYAFGEVWSRPALDRRARSIATISLLIAQGQSEELAGHIQGGLRNGLTREEIAELIIHSVIYVGVPRARQAFAVAVSVLGEHSGG